MSKLSLEVAGVVMRVHPARPFVDLLKLPCRIPPDNLPVVS
jgi:hypothetical protein